MATTFTYTGAAQSWTVPSSGTYVIECWGAQGGASDGIGGKGGYAKGSIDLSAGETLTVYVGGHPASRPGGWNGGGNGSNSAGGNGYGGGGGTDVRRNGTALANRIIVAGGGGGDRSGGFGGGTVGNDAGNGVYSVGSGGYGGTQTAGGAGGDGGADVLGLPGQLGVGGNGGFGGGGGYYGGGGGGLDTYSGTASPGGGGSGYIGGVTNGTMSTGVQSGDGQVAITKANNPPNAPALNFPAHVNAAATNRLPWTFSDPDAGDSQSAFNLYYRAQGASTWTKVAQSTPNNWWDAPAGTFTAGTTYEGQVETYDSQGVLGARSTSTFFDAQQPPDGPAIIDPANGQTIPADSYTGVISAPTVDASEWTLYADDGAGNIDTATILHGPVTVTPADGDVRRYTFTGLANNVPVWWSVRTEDSGLWSAPTQDVRTPVSYAPPPAPTFTVDLDPASGSALISITNPAPAPGEPSVSYNDVYIDDGNGKGFERKVTLLQPNTAWRYWTPPSGFDPAGNVRVTAVATNGTTASTTSPVNVTSGGTPGTTATVIYDGGTP